MGVKLGLRFFQRGASGLVLGAFELALAQGLFQRAQLRLGAGQLLERTLGPFTLGGAMFPLVSEPCLTLLRRNVDQLPVQGVSAQGLPGLSQSLLGLLQLLPAARYRRQCGAVLALEFAACQLGLLEGLSGFGQLGVFLLLLGGELGRLRGGRRPLAEGVVVGAANRAGLTFPQRFAQPCHALAASGAAALDEIAQSGVALLAAVESLTGGLALNGQFGLTLLIPGQALAQVALGKLGPQRLLPAAGQFIQLQAAAGGVVVGQLRGLAGGIEPLMAAHQLAQGGLPLVAPTLQFVQPGRGGLVLLVEGLCLLAAALMTGFELGQLTLERSQRLSVLARLSQARFGLLAGLAGGFQLTSGLIPCLFGLGLQNASALECCLRLAVDLLQGGDFTRQRGLAQQVMALGRKQAAAVTVGPDLGQRLPACIGLALLANAIVIGLAQPLVGAMPLSLGVELPGLLLQAGQSLFGVFGLAFQLTAGLGLGGQVIGEFRLQGIDVSLGRDRPPVGGFGDA